MPSPLSALVLASLVAASAAAEERFFQHLGAVIVEAEDLPHAGWRRVPGASGAALQDEGGHLEATLVFTETGIHRCWFLHAYTGDRSGERNDCFVEFDGRPLRVANTAVAPYGMVTHAARPTWGNDPKIGDRNAALRKRPAYIVIERPGAYRLLIRSRSPGYVLDKLVFAPDAAAPTWTDALPSTRTPVLLTEVPSPSPAVARQLDRARRGAPGAAWTALAALAGDASATAARTAIDAWATAQIARLDALLAAGDPLRAAQAAAWLAPALRGHPGAAAVIDRARRAAAHPSARAGAAFTALLKPLHAAEGPKRAALLEAFAATWGAEDPYTLAAGIARER